MVSSADGSRRAVPMPMAFIPPRWAASIPAAESSKTRHCSGGSPRASAPLRNPSGLGLPFTIFLPSITASKKRRNFQLFQDKLRIFADTAKSYSVSLGPGNA